MKYYLTVITTLLAVHLGAQTSITRFASGLDSLRRQLNIPAMSVALEKDHKVLLKTAFGYADLEHKIKATSATAFRVASVTKTFTSTLIMQLVEKRQLDLDSPISQYDIDLGNSQITVRNLLTHTSEGKPGSAFRYNGYRYGQLGPIIEKASGKPFYALLMERIVMPLQMTSTAPGISLDQYFQYCRKNKAVRPYFQNAFGQLARPYDINRNGQVVLSEYLNEFGAFGGLATTATDLLKYSDAIDSNRFVSAFTQRQIFTANSTTGGNITPYGLGWFVQRYQGLNFYWHYGQTQGESALFIKVPQLKLTLAVLCNSDKLSQPFPLGDGDLFTSPVGQWFYRCLIGTSTDSGFYNRQLIAGATMALFNRDTTKAQQIYAEYARLNFSHAQAIPTGNVIAGIENAGVNKELATPFALSQPTKVKVFGVGENCSSDLSAWCDYGWIEDAAGKVVWQMQGQPASSAGGAIKNQKVEQVLSLRPGNYVLHYKSDAAHAFDSWDSLPPDNFFWGIILLNAEK